ncbi:unnamed protein product [Nesidiocoris tenuis]|uniref:Uncharacterized protein n=1 Tax=Nesidiocoris tenuis TaxID=355587 RepID=A0A6H5HHH4_9HEMI|nr:unnamed protein product [Nesidiocoris tenuis]CAB0016172.1 unnamed protein product [Nesidiocoris tenuis]
MRFSQFNTCVEWSTLAIKASIRVGKFSFRCFQWIGIVQNLNKYFTVNMECWEEQLCLVVSEFGVQFGVPFGFSESIRILMVRDIRI